ncbi:MAG: sigma-70 family RNA polymerase sigma factor, partial [Massilia sp.]|nr:sigma-70 family RNA polymerase sigma factor [Massilia sp.]
MPAPTPTPTPTPARRAGTAKVDPQDDAEDRRLIVCVCRHELGAFETLYRRYHPRLGRFLHRMLRPEHLIEEVLNDTMLVVWNQADRFNGQSKVSTWIFAIAYRKALKAIDRHDEPMAAPLDEDQQPVAEFAERPDERMGLAQARAAIDAALRTLSCDQRAAVELTYFQGFSYPEIAQIVDCPTDTVKTRMFHARKRLRTA